MEFEATLVWGLFTRLLGLLMAWAIGQNLFQAKALVSDLGISPMSTKLKRIRRDFGLRNGIWYFPTLLWISTKLIFIRFLLIVGVFCGLAIVVGLPGTGYYFLTGFIIYLSFDVALGFSYPWDSLLFETMILGSFLPQLAFFPHLEALEEPHAVIAFLYRFLLFRLLFGFGKYKFSKPNFKDSGYFKNFLINVPLPSPLASIVSKSPSWAFRLMYGFAFILEIIIPFVSFIPGETRLICFLLITCLMIGIQTLSNFGFFNLLTIVLAFTLLNTQSFIYLDWSFNWSSENFIMLFVLAFYVIFGLFSLPFNSWCSFTWMHWPNALFLKGHWLDYPVTFIRWISRLRIVHAYGVFPVKSQPPMKLIPLIEVSLDGKDWKRYSYKYTLSNEGQKMKFVAPYHPRIDHAVFYDSFAINNTNFNWSTVGSCLPFDYAYRGGTDNIIQAILAGNKSIESLLGKNPLEGKTPKFARMGLFYAVPAKVGNKREIYLADVHRLPKNFEENYEELSDSPPEIYHWDAVFWRDRTKLGKHLRQLSSEENLDLVLSNLKEGLSASHLEEWTSLSIKYQFCQADWSQWIEEVKRFEIDQSFLERKSLYRYWNRIRIVLSHRLHSAFLEKEKHTFGSDYYAFGLFLHQVIANGKDAIKELWKSPTKLWELSQGFDKMKGFYIEAFWRPEAGIDHFRKLQWSEQVTDSQEEEVLPGFNRITQSFSKLPLECSLKAWPRMDYSPSNGEWKLGEAVSAKENYPDLFHAYQNQTPSPSPY